MGCFSSKPTAEPAPKKKKEGDAFKRPQWKSDGSWDEAELQRKREEFWDTQPAYGGAKDGPAKAFSLHEAYEAHINRGFGAEIWDTLKAVTSDLDNPNNKLILESAGVTVHGNDLRTTYDERGFKYDLPNFILSEPTNLAKGKQTPAPTTEQSTAPQHQVEYES